MSDHSHGREAAFRRWGYAMEREQQRADRAVGDLFPDVKAPPGLEDGDQRFTTRETDAWCRKVAGVEKWDLDVAACEESHLAEAYFTRESDGLKQLWSGGSHVAIRTRVWCNPPFSDIEPWVQRAWDEMSDEQGPGVVAMLLPGSRTEQAWWQKLVEPHRDRPSPFCADRGIEFTTHFLPGRTRFGHPGNPEGVGVGSPPFGCVLLVWRRS